MKLLKITLVTLVVLSVLIYLVVHHTFRTSSEDVSHLKPFSEIIGKELTTIQPCFIALNYKDWVKENQYIVSMKRNKLSGNVTNLQELPKGSVFKITDAKRFTDGATGFKSTYVLGLIFLENKEEVQFEFAWGSKNYGTDLPGDYFSYSLAPWQNTPINMMYNYKEGIEAPYENYNQKSTH